MWWTKRDIPWPMVGVERELQQGFIYKGQGETGAKVWHRESCAEIFLVFSYQAPLFLATESMMENRICALTRKACKENSICCSIQVEHR